MRRMCVYNFVPACIPVGLGMALWLGDIHSLVSQPHLPEHKAGAVRSNPPPDKVRLFSQVQQFDLANSSGLTNLLVAVEACIRLAEQQDQQIKGRRQRMLETTALADMTPAELRQFHAESPDKLGKNDLKGLKELQRLASLALTNPEPVERNAFTRQIQEVAAAINNYHRPPVREHIDVLQIPFVHWRYTHNEMARGHSPASNLDPAASPQMDLSRIDPLPSPFWVPPSEIATQDLYHGFGRAELPDIAQEICLYAGPKTSFGGNAGYELTCGGRKVKVKFGEIHSEPFAARIFVALGYKAEPTDYIPSLRVRYDRRLLREFHLRKEIHTRILLLGCIPIYTFQFQRHFDPFQFISSAVLKDGRRLSSDEFKRFLFYHPGRTHPEDFPSDFKPAAEQQIDFLLTTPANVQIKGENIQSLGPWDFGQLGHEHRRELRGAGLLAAWLGWSDSRFENTRLKVRHQNGQTEWLGLFSDLGN
jgi:hypothetical protein